MTRHPQRPTTKRPQLPIISNLTIIIYTPILTINIITTILDTIKRLITITIKAGRQILLLDFTIIIFRPLPSSPRFLWP